MLFSSAHRTGQPALKFIADKGDFLCCCHDFLFCLPSRACEQETAIGRQVDRQADK